MPAKPIPLGQSTFGHCSKGRLIEIVESQRQRISDLEWEKEALKAEKKNLAKPVYCVTERQRDDAERERDLAKAEMASQRSAFMDACTAFANGATR